MVKINSAVSVQSMVHLNGNLLCAIDTETTGLDPTIHEIVEIAIVPLNASLQPMGDIFPFSMKLRPENLSVIDESALKVNGQALQNLLATGVCPLRAADMFDDWFNSLKLPVGKKIVPLGHNYGFDCKFISKWLGEKTYSSYFDYHYRDTVAAALFLNDWAAFHAEKIPFPKVNLKYVGTTLKVQNLHSHTALSDAITTAECYRKMVLQGPYIPT